MPHPPDRRLACFTHFVVAGPIGSGKSSLVRKLAGYLGADGRLAGKSDTGRSLLARSVIGESRGRAPNAWRPVAQDVWNALARHSYNHKFSALRAPTRLTKRLTTKKSRGRYTAALRKTAPNLLSTPR